MATVLHCSTGQLRTRESRVARQTPALPAAAWLDAFCPDFLSQASVTWRADKPCLSAGDVDCPESREWDAHWDRQRRGTFGRLCSLYRRHVRSRCVRRYIDRYFPAAGIFAECGCGSGETSQRLKEWQAHSVCRPDAQASRGSQTPGHLGVAPNQDGRTYLAVDFCARALDRALIQTCYAAGVQADIRALPFRDNSLDGLWNLGVLEHFEADEQLLILREFHRVLKPGGVLLLWWPPKVAPDQLLLKLFGKSFPDEPGRVKAAAMSTLLFQAGYDHIQMFRPWSDGKTEFLVTAVAPAVILK